MTVDPVASDLIADVMKAADPAAQRVAASRLQRLARPGEANFAATVQQEFAAAQTVQAADPAAIDRPSVEVPVTTTPFVRRAEGSNAVYRKFEAFVLQMFVESMLPKDSEELFGKGTSGQVWRSMLAEQIGNEIAKGNGVGIAKQLEKSRPTSAPPIES